MKFLSELINMLAGMNSLSKLIIIVGSAAASACAAAAIAVGASAFAELGAITRAALTDKAASLCLSLWSCAYIAAAAIETVRLSAVRG